MTRFSCARFYFSRDAPRAAQAGRSGQRTVERCASKMLSKYTYNKPPARELVGTSWVHASPGFRLGVKGDLGRSERACSRHHRGQSHCPAGPRYHSDY